MSRRKQKVAKQLPQGDGPDRGPLLLVAENRELVCGWCEGSDYRITEYNTISALSPWLVNEQVVRWHIECNLCPKDTKMRDSIMHAEALFEG